MVEFQCMKCVRRSGGPAVPDWAEYRGPPNTEGGIGGPPAPLEARPGPRLESRTVGDGDLATLNADESAFLEFGHGA